MSALHALAFGDLQTQTWGVGWLSKSENGTQLVAGHGSRTDVLEVALESGQPGEAWHLMGPGASLELQPTGPSGRGRSTDDGLESLEELCNVTGRLEIGDQALEVRCLGWRSSLEGEVDLGRIDSFRLLAGWLDPQAGFSLLALRPRKARAHDADIVAAALIDDPPAPPVADPRLSTTYGETGRPARAGLELWLEEAAEDDPETVPAHQYPRRAAGQAVGMGLDWGAGDFELHASLLRWHSHGREGPGVYVLGQRR